MRKFVAIAIAASAAALAQPADPKSQVDKIFARYNSRSTPGCAVGVSVKGDTVLGAAYGMADLEHDVPNTPRPYLSVDPSPSNSPLRRCCSWPNRASSRSTTPCANTFPSCPITGEADHDPPPAEPHQRFARLGERRGDRRLAARRPRPHARSARCRRLLFGGRFSQDGRVQDTRNRRAGDGGQPE